MVIKNKEITQCSQEAQYGYVGMCEIHAVESFTIHTFYTTKVPHFCCTICHVKEPYAKSLQVAS
jgi:hypothetical protein